MADRRELMEAALETYPEGIALLDDDRHIVFWNRAAESISGFPRLEIVGRAVPWELEPLLEHHCCDEPAEHGERAILVHTQHKLGDALPMLVRSRVLRDGMGVRIGCIVTFRDAAGWNSLPHGSTTDATGAGEAQASLEERVEEVFSDSVNRGINFGLLWITVDQADELRRTHGARACESMLERVERTVSSGLRPGEEMGRWGDDEFLVLCHESGAEALKSRAQLLAGIARTTDFRWWGDRVSLAVSIGAAQADHDESLIQLLERAQAAMHTSMHAGGNQITLAPGRRTCSPS